MAGFGLVALGGFAEAQGWWHERSVYSVGDAFGRGFGQPFLLRVVEDSDDEDAHTGLRDSVRAYARKAFHLRQSTAQEKEKKRVMSVASAKYAFMEPPSLTRRPSAFSISTERRASIQRGVATVKERVSKLANWSPVPGTNDKKSPIPRELRSPAIPITPYQQLGTKAWEPPSRPPRSPKQRKDTGKEKEKEKAPKRKVPFAILSSSKTGSRGPDAPHPYRPRLRRSASEKRRDELRAKIVVVRPPDVDREEEEQEGKVTHWV